MEHNNSNRLALWFNDKRETQTHPHLKGTGEASGTGVWVSAWFSSDIAPDDAKALMAIVKRYQANSRAPFISISLKVKEGGGKVLTEKQIDAAGEEDDIPFN